MFFVDAVEAPVVMQMSRADVAVDVSRFDTREFAIRDESVALKVGNMRIKRERARGNLIQPYRSQFYP